MNDKRRNERRILPQLTARVSPSPLLQDGRAERVAGVTGPSSVFDIAEWTVVSQGLTSPMDFDPFAWVGEGSIVSRRAGRREAGDIAKLLERIGKDRIG